MIELISAGIGVIGVVIGWVLNELTTTFRSSAFKWCLHQMMN